MMTLITIQDAESLHDDFRFRREVYAASPSSGFLRPASEPDQEEYDQHAPQFGRYVRGRVGACARSIEGRDTGRPIPTLGYFETARMAFTRLNMMGAAILMRGFLGFLLPEPGMLYVYSGSNHDRRTRAGIGVR